MKRSIVKNTVKGKGKEIKKKGTKDQGIKEKGTKEKGTKDQEIKEKEQFLNDIKTLLLLHRQGKISHLVPKDIQYMNMIELIIQYKGIHNSLIFAIDIGNVKWVRTILERKEIDLYKMENFDIEERKEIEIERKIEREEMYIGEKAREKEMEKERKEREKERDFYKNTFTVFRAIDAGTSENKTFDIVKLLIDYGANFRFENDISLVLAAQKGYIEIVKYLVELGANVNSERNPLNGAVKGGNIDIVKYLISEGAEIRSFQELLISAILSNNINMVKYIVSHMILPGGLYSMKSSPFVPDITIVEKAIEIGNLDILKYLIKEGLFITKNRDIFEWVLRGGNLEVIKLLFELDMLNVKNLDTNSLADLVIKGRTDILIFLLRQGLSSKQNGKILWASSLYQTSDMDYYHKNRDVLKFILSRDLKVSDAYLKKSFPELIKKRDQDMLILLFKRVKKPLYVIQSLDTIALEKYEDMIPFLVDLLESYVTRDVLVRQAVKLNSIKMLETMLDKEYDFRFNDDIIIVDAVKYGELNTIRFLLDHGVNVNAYDDQALIFSVNHNDRFTTKVLLEHGANVNARKEMALFTAITNNNISMMELLLEYGSDIHIDNDAPLLKSIRQESLDMVNLLLKYGAYPDAQHGRPIIEAIKLNSVAIFKALIKKGAQIDLVKEEAYKIAEEQKYDDILEILNNLD